MSSLQHEQKIKDLLRIVAQQSASDLHLVVGKPPTIRLDGKLVPLAREEILTIDSAKELAEVMMTEENKKEFEEVGQVDFSYNFDDKARFRVNVFMQRGKVSAAMRLITGKIRDLEELNINPTLYDFMKKNQGLLLITGPVGHGKTTTSSALLDYVNHNYDKHIITIEDPIEYLYEADRCIINQREVGRDTRSFAEGLRSVFREDANVVLIGEMRDLDTISTAMTAAETGHLIVATLHTNDASQTVDRIVDVFPAHQQNQIRSQLASVLLGVVSQRLVPKVGGGRIPALEIMFRNSAIENLIRENKTYQIPSVIETSLKDGMISIERSLADMVKRGIVTADDALVYATNPEYFNMLMSKK